MAGHVKPLTNATKTGTGTIKLDGYLFGGYDLNCDGTNEGTLIVRDGDSAGTVLVDVGSITGKNMLAPIKTETGSIYYSISGTGADAMLYEWKV